MHKLKELVMAEIRKCKEYGVCPKNVTYLGALVDIVKDISEIHHNGEESDKAGAEVTVKALMDDFNNAHERYLNTSDAEDMARLEKSARDLLDIARGIRGVMNVTNVNKQIENEYKSIFK